MIDKLNDVLNEINSMRKDYTVGTPEGDAVSQAYRKIEEGIFWISKFHKPSEEVDIEDVPVIMNTEPKEGPVDNEPELEINLED